jgi:hypothetical protein
VKWAYASQGRQDRQIARHPFGDLAGSVSWMQSVMRGHYLHKMFTNDAITIDTAKRAKVQ